MRRDKRRSTEPIDQRIRWSNRILWAWLDLNQRPHPYQQSRAYRCATLHFCWSLPTVEGEVRRCCSLPEPAPTSCPCCGQGMPAICRRQGDGAAGGRGSPIERVTATVSGRLTDPSPAAGAPGGHEGQSSDERQYCGQSPKGAHREIEDDRPGDDGVDVRSVAPVGMECRHDPGRQASVIELEGAQARTETAMKGNTSLSNSSGSGERRLSTSRAS
jgi:hypothetical protein